MSKAGVALFLMSAVLLVPVMDAQAAAPRVTASAYPASLEGKQAGKHRFTLAGGRVVECSTASFSGSYTAAEAAEATMSLTPTYAECTAEILGNATPATVTTNGCSYQLTDEEKASGTIAEEGWEQTGALQVKCPEGKKLEIHVWESKATHEANGTPLCTYTVGAQGPLQSVDYKLDEAGKKVTVNATVANLSVSLTTGTTANCGAASQTGSYGGNSAVEAFQTKEVQLTGSLDAAETGTPRVTTSSYPATITGKQLGKHRFTLAGGRVVECSIASLSGSYSEAESKAEKATMSLTPSYSECTAEILGNATPATVTTNGCSYQLTDEEKASGGIAEEGWEYTGALQVKCPEGKKIEIHVWESKAIHEANGTPLCTYTIGEQGPLKSVDYKLDEAGKKITVDATGLSLAVSRTTGTAVTCGTASQTATYSGNTGLEGVLLERIALTTSLDSGSSRLTPSPAEYPVTLKGTQTVANVLELEGTRPTECATATFEGTIASKAEAGESKLTVRPTYSSCTTNVLGTKDQSTVTMNECDYVLTTTETTTGTIAAEGWEVTGKENHIQCPAGKEIEIHVFASEAKHIANESLCTYKIGAQTPSGDLDYKLTEKNGEGAGTAVDIKSTLTGITVSKASGTLTNCGAVSQNGTLKGEIKVEGFNVSGVMLRAKFDKE